MKWQWSVVALFVLGSTGLAQSPPQEIPGQAIPFPAPDTTGTTVLEHADPTLFTSGGHEEAKGGFLSGNHNFPNFINFISNPLQSIDPRAVTAIYPLGGSSWVSNVPPIPDGNFQVLGPALTVALTDRLAIGMNQGGYAFAQFSRNQGGFLALLDPQGRFRDVEAGGSRQGWLNLGGFVQYTLIEDVDDQFLLTGGMRWAAPCGSYEIFQGHGPLELAPYLTGGKEFGEFHVLATAGYQFPAGPGSDNTKLWYANLHLDRRLFGCLYPLVEFNCSYHEKSVSFGLPTRSGFIDFGDLEAEGNVLTMAAGANVVLIPERLEFGAVYSTLLASQHNVDLNGFIVKMTLRY